MLKAEKPDKFITRIILRLIPKKLQDSQNTRMKSMVLLLTLFCNISMLCITLPFILYGFKDSPIIEEGGVILIGACLATYFFSFVIFYRFSSLIFAGNIALTAIFMTAASTSWLTGGSFSPMVFLFLIPPVFSFIITNITSGVIWTLISSLSFLTLWALDSEFMMAEEYEYLQPMLVMLNPTDLSFLTIIMRLLSLGMIVAIVGIYESYSIRLNKMLSKERNLFAFKASHDALTGLANRAEFDARLKVAIENARHSSYSLALIYIDLDGFKPINDTIGHHAGDVVLEAVSARLSKIVRGTDTVARLGGDEFAIILQGIDNEVKITPILEKVLKTLGEDIIIDEKITVNVHGSLGIAFYPENADSPDSLCRHADMAMYLAKEEKNTWRFFNQIPKKIKS
jgi:diguanylate cyclase (GGDEF)-like protein